MANTQGFELVIQSAQSVILKALRGAWKSDECPDQDDNTGRIPEFMDIPPVGDVGGYPIVDGHVQIPQEELNAAFAPEVNGVELVFGLNVQLEIGNPPVPSAQLLDFHAVLRAKSEVGTLPDIQDVGILLADLERANVSAELDEGHPLDSSMEELLQDYIDQAYEDEVIPHVIPENDVTFFVATMNTETQIFNDESNPSRKINATFPNADTLQISIPIYLRMFAFVPNPISIVGFEILMESPMGIETRININAPFEKDPDKYVAKFEEVTEDEVTIGPISGAGADIAGIATEADNYQTNKDTLADLIIPQDLDALITEKLKEKGAEFANQLMDQEVLIPSISEIETQIADIFHAELTTRGHLAIWSPTASNDEFAVSDVEVKVFDDSLNIALNATDAADIDALDFFIPDEMEFSIAMSRPSLEAKIQEAITENGFDGFPVRFVEDGKDVDLNSLSVSVVDFAIRLQGTVTVIDAVLGSIDVDASFRTDVGFRWEPNGVADESGFQSLEHQIIGDPDVDVDEGIAFWIVAIILAVVSFGLGGVLIGVISIVVILIVKAIVENIGSDSLVNGVTGAIDGITAWPPELANIGRVRAVFFDPVDISTSGLVISGQLEVISSCESTQIVPATTAGAYITNAVQDTELKALRIYDQADFFWNPGDGSPVQPIKTVFHKYEQSGLYLAKHGVNVTEYGGAASRHFALVKVRNIPPSVNAGPDITINEGEVIQLEARFEDVEYLDTHWSIWNFGDDQPMQMGFVEETNEKPVAKGVSRAEHAWCDNGTYYVSVQVIDQNGGVGTDTIKVTVLNVPPEVRTPRQVYAYPCSPVTLYARFRDPGWCDTHEATWELGDCSVIKMATVQEINEAPAARGIVTVSHIYRKCGSYDTECIVTDDDGGVGNAHTTVEVIELKNAYFNDGFSYNHSGMVANHWTAFQIPFSSEFSDLKSARYFCEKCLVFDGLSSQRIVGGQDSLLGIYQCLGANPGWVYQVDAMYLLNNEVGTVRLGVDPYGQTDPSSSNIIWSEGNLENLWSHLLVRACAKADCITIFLVLECERGVIAECCFDAVQVVPMQNMKCTEDIKQTPAARICLDFEDIKREIEVPVEWHYQKATFTAVSAKVPNRIVQTYRPVQKTCLWFRRGLVIDFDQAVEDVIMEFCFSQILDLSVIASDDQGNTISEQSALLEIPTSSMKIGGSSIKRIYIYTKGEGRLCKICYRRSSKTPGSPIKRLESHNLQLLEQPKTLFTHKIKDNE